MKPETLIEVIDAAHLSHMVTAPFKQRGGIILVAPPGQLKTSLISAALQGYHDANIMSDVNVKTLMELRQDIIGGKICTLGFTALEKLYARNLSTARNVEASLMAFVEEGFTKASFESQNGPPARPARAMVIAGTFNTHIEQMWTAWQKSGFTRRFLWVNYSLENPAEIIRSIHLWEPLTLGKITRSLPIQGTIPYDLTDTESSFILDIMKFQNEATPIVLMKKVFSVLKWKHNAEKAIEILNDFGECLTKSGASVMLPVATRKAAAYSL